LVNPIANIYLKGFYRNLFHIFLSLIIFSTYFINLLDFLEILKQNQNPKKKKRWNSAGPAFGPRLQPAGVAQWPIQHGRPGHPTWARSTITTPCSRARRRSGAGADSSPTDEAAQGWWDKCPHGVADPSGKERRVAAHRIGVVGVSPRTSFGRRRSVGGGGSRWSVTVQEGSCGTGEEGERERWPKLKRDGARVKLTVKAKGGNGNGGLRSDSG
jgi:hypothetical protein